MQPLAGVPARLPSPAGVRRRTLHLRCTSPVRLAEPRLAPACASRPRCAQALLGREFARHPCLVQTFDLGVRPLEAPEGPAPGALVRHALWVVMQLCSRGSLREWRGGRRLAEEAERRLQSWRKCGLGQASSPPSPPADDAITKGRFHAQAADAQAPPQPNLLAVLQTVREIAGAFPLGHPGRLLRQRWAGAAACAAAYCTLLCPALHPLQAACRCCRMWASFMVRLRL